MIQFLLFVLFIGLAGLAIGTLTTVKVWYPLPLFLVILGAGCFLLFWFGVLIGGTIFSWVPLFFTKIFIILFCLGLAVFFFRQYHPSHGYFPFQGFIHWILLGLFFFIIGIDFAIIGFSAWLLLFLLPFFAGTVFLGSMLMWKLKRNYRFGILTYAPLFIFFFLAVFKLL